MERIKLTKEHLDQVRNVEGFPIGKDEDIIALSDAPYYTACPNPFIEDFIQEYGKPYDEATDGYHREPFAADVTEGKNDPIYNAHSYHTKVPHKAIMRYIMHYTEPGDIVFDGFCGTGMTGVAAQLCANPDPQFKLQIEKEMGPVKWGARRAILNDLSPAATFIAYNYNTPVDAEEFEREARRILAEVEKECGWMYETQHTINGVVQTDLEGKPIIGKINYTVWSDVFICPECSQEVVFWDAAVDKAMGTVKDEFACPYCGARLTKRNMERAWITKFDKAINETVRQARQVPVLINYSVLNKRFEKEADPFDITLINKIEDLDIPYIFPTDRMPEGYNTEQPKRSHGISHVHHFFTRRNLYALSKVFQSSCKSNHYRNLLLFVIGSLRILSKQAKHNKERRTENSGLGWVNAGVTGTLYISSCPAEQSALFFLRKRLKKYYLNKQESSEVLLSTQSTSQIAISDDTVDYIFTDPPFGGNIMYSELNFIWESWLRVYTMIKPEAIVNMVRRKNIYEYQEIMLSSFREMYSMLKPGRWLTMVFHNSQNAIWNMIQEALLKSGFVIADVRVLNKQQGSFKQVTTTSAIKEDLVVSAYKPRKSFLKKLQLVGGTEQGVWDFVEQHADQLPVVAVKGGIIEKLAERQNFMLYDRMVAFHLLNGYSIPMGAAEFYQGLKQRFPERDGMYFLPNQIPEYEQKRALAKEVEQLSLFVQDERTGIQWIRTKLEERPQTLQELTPQFMKEAKYFRWEKQLELSELLDQNFLQDEKGHWYVPDPNKQADLEKLREKALLREFGQYFEGKGKLKVFRTEAIRAGFKAYWRNKDYKGIVKVAERIPEAVIQEDVTLLMYYNNALTRIEG